MLQQFLVGKTGIQIVATFQNGMDIHVRQSGPFVDRNQIMERLQDIWDAFDHLSEREVDSDGNSMWDYDKVNGNIEITYDSKTYLSYDGRRITGTGVHHPGHKDTIDF